MWNKAVDGCRHWTSASISINLTPSWVSHFYTSNWVCLDLTASATKNVTFFDEIWNIYTKVKGCYRGTYRLHSYGWRISREESAQLAACFTPISYLAYSLILTMEAMYSDVTPLDFPQTTGRYIPEDRILQPWRCFCYIWSATVPRKEPPWVNFTHICPEKLGFPLGRAIAQAVIRWLPTVADRVRARVRSCEICGGQSGAGAGFLQVLRFSLPKLIPPIASQSLPSIIWGWYNRPVIAAVASGLSFTPLIIIIIIIRFSLLRPSPYPPPPSPVV
jgi:hypothetical protein